jgi:ferredoxin-type protein NapF
MVDARRRLFLRGKRSKPAASPARPPWSLRPDEAFTAACSRCGDCVRACAQQVLREGDGGFPVIDFSAAGCSLCGDCSRVCTSGAIGRSEDGAAAFRWTADVDGRCLARHGVECRICGDACDADALRFVPTLGGVAQLRLEREVCSGCGECVSRCPVHALRMVDAPAGNR